MNWFFLSIAIGLLAAIPHRQLAVLRRTERKVKELERAPRSNERQPSRRR